ncbi:AcrB/AcrD/AcrF family protein [Terriglobus albidus]|uniref:AcrB/AcrD/AcrF family protein n=1 Tax=Terriglobus albidus TaxID=1592106 RepID=A0A5B9E9B1_9BACT|nr:GRP family sugar transporter [Terriglobus albidus]QEE28803.1 AcrB/AcrD/AcrF family protein [Terriglobus albidus]
MYQPETYGVALLFMIVSMLCWGSWANSMKLCPGYRFQLFYWDYVIGLVAGAVLWGVALGSMGSAGRSFLTDIVHTGAYPILLAMASGAIFNVANLLLVAAIDIAGLAVAFPVGIGLALIVGAVSTYVISPQGNPVLLFGGIALVSAAILFDAIAYRLRETEHAAMSRRGIIISLVAGLLMGTFYPLVSKAMTVSAGPGPYAALLFFALGVAVCAVPVNYFLMRFPLDGREPVFMQGYWQAQAGWHLWGMIGGAIWGTGAMANFVASQAHIVGPTVSYSIGQGATMISACWGVFVWHEFSVAPARAKAILGWMFVLFLCGLTAVACAPIF